MTVHEDRHTDSALLTIVRVYKLYLLTYLLTNGRTVYLSVTYHKREGDGRGLNALDHPHGDEADELNEREDVNSSQPAVAQVDVVRLIFHRHQHDQQSVVELQAIKHTHTHTLTPV